MAIPITWAALTSLDGDSVGVPTNGGLQDNDQISFRFESAPNLPGDQVELVFRTAEHIRWWKEILVSDSQRRRIASLGGQDDDHGPKFTRLNISRLAGAKFVFFAARMFGVHIDMYELSLSQGDLNAMAGRRLTFSWDNANA